ncbi:hypothetical protein EYF80_060704 [Liparis tanakae]|uniref:Uncharacterized protein n=1 Tax=Liparis tanakae TaxID=230148 RepID=A0A4Z2EJW0_9TELE|nr:hypothetical protein EYF80_060704 [Liparis tanakae]
MRLPAGRRTMETDEAAQKGTTLFLLALRKVENILHPSSRKKTCGRTSFIRYPPSPLEQRRGRGVRSVQLERGGERLQFSSHGAERIETLTCYFKRSKRNPRAARRGFASARLLPAFPWRRALVTRLYPG